MTQTPTAPYGSWLSPLTTDLIVAETVRLGEPSCDAEDAYWVETRPAEAGRSVLVRCTPDGAQLDVTPPPYSVRSRAHEYGGAAYLAAGGTVWFVNDADQAIYRISPGETPERLTPADARRYTDMVLDARRRRLVCVCEDHGGDGEPANRLVSVATDSGRVATLCEGHDFYSSPRLSPDGAELAWLAWRHPNLPWDTTEVWVATIADDGQLADHRAVVSDADESCFQPEWGPDGALYFVSDRSDWWNLYRWDGEKTVALTRADAEMGLPQWIFGMSTYGFSAPGEALCAFTSDGIWRLKRLDLTSGKITEVAVPCDAIEHVHVSPGRALVLGGSPTLARAILDLDVARGQHRVLRSSSAIEWDERYLSHPEPVTFPTTGGAKAHALYYPPRNPRFQAPPGELPPLLVQCHGGPTAATNTALKPALQYWTSRGIAILDVNYRGSTGYGRKYRQELYGEWGVADVDDCVNGALHMAERGGADRERFLISGGSAGGYTVLCALTFRDTFRAGASYFGVADLEALFRDTHKFEARYDHWMLGAEADEKLYRARSPIHHAERMSCPVIFFQGLKDRVVPPNQSETMVAALRAKGVPVAYLSFPEEAHGFRAGTTIKTCLEAEFQFYARILGYQPADAMEPLEIENF